MRVVVTGASGRIGQVVVSSIVASGHDVVATDRVERPVPSGTTFVLGDLRDRAFVVNLLDGADAVAHLAAIPAPLGYPDDEIFASNVHSTYLVLDEAGRAGIPRIVSISSLSALGLAWAEHDVLPSYLPVDEAHPLLVEDPYALSKQTGEMIAAMVSRRWGVTVVSLRFPFVASGEQLRRRVADIRAEPASGRKELWGWLDTRDAAAAVLASLTAAVSGSPVLQIVAPTTLSDVPTAELVDRYLPSVERRARFEGLSGLFDCRDAAVRLHFEPSFSHPPSPDTLPVVDSAQSAQ